ncbi:MAG: YDG domain-containing protein [Nitrospirae bacterium]|nr:YDG domain-containing protein [Nitrospirota bacterium]
MRKTLLVVMTVVFALISVMANVSHAWWSETLNANIQSTHDLISKQTSSIIQGKLQNQFLKDKLADIMDYTFHNNAALSTEWDKAAHRGDGTRNGGPIDIFYQNFLTAYQAYIADPGDSAALATAVSNLGYAVHLVEDMAVPAHALNIKHAATSALDSCPFNPAICDNFEGVGWEIFAHENPFYASYTIAETDSPTPTEYYRRARNNTINLVVSSPVFTTYWHKGTGDDWCGDNWATSTMPNVCDDGPKGYYETPGSDSDDQFSFTYETAMMNPLLGGAPYEVDFLRYQLNQAVKYSGLFLLAVDRVLSAQTLTSYPVDLPKTGQTICYDGTGNIVTCSSTGQDGELQSGVSWPQPRFVIQGNCVTDHLTGLMWVQNANLPGYKTWQQTMDYISAINTGSGLCGYNDWRLPNVNELESLVNAGQANPAMWLNSQGFAGTQAGLYWTSTSYSTYSAMAWVLDMGVGAVYDSNSKSNSGYGWPVRTDQTLLIVPSAVWKTGQSASYYANDDGALQKGISWPTTRFADNGNTVIDGLTYLVWTKNANSPGPSACSPGGLKTWQQALDYIKCLNSNNYLGYNDWKLPNRKELYSLTDKSNHALPSGNPFLNVMPYYWSSTTSVSNAQFAWVIGINDYYGIAYNVNKSSGEYVWPVRLGQKGSLGTALSGTVTSFATGGPIAGVTVTVLGGTTTQTDSSGIYSINGINYNTWYNVTFSAIGYQTVTVKNIVLEAGQVKTLNVMLPTTGPLNIITTSLPPADTGHAYSSRVMVTGGSYPYTFSTAYGSLPPGLNLNIYNGAISGTPTIVGSYTFAVGLTDNNALYSEREFTIEVTAPLTITTPSLLDRGTIGASYQQSLNVTGGTAPYTFSYSGDFPLDLYLTNLGNITNKITDTIDFESGVLNKSWSVSNAYINSENKLFLDGHYTTATAQITVNCTAGNISFDFTDYFYCGNDFCGHLIFYVDGVEKKRWYHIDYNVINAYAQAITAGVHTFKWESYNSNVTRVNTFSKIDNIKFPIALLGSHNFTINVSDSSGRNVAKQFTLNIDNALSISTTRLNDGIVGSSFNQTLTATGGYGTYQWDVYSGSLPAGLSLDGSTGIISGTPTTATNSIIILSVADADGRITYKDFNIKVSNPLQILTASVPNGFLNSAYSEAIRLAGGIGPYTFSMTGQLPAGLTLNTATGIISGTPTAAGLTNVSITVTDSTYPVHQTITQNLGIRIWTQLTITTTAVLASNKKGVAISPIVFVAKGGASPYTWALTSGALPQGLTFAAATGQLSGTPTEAGDFIFTLTVMDSSSATAQKEFFMHVSDTVTITTSAVPDGAKGTPYSYALNVSNGIPPYSWLLQSGTLPSGITLNSSTGVLSGTPTTKQAYSFTIRVSDSDSPAQTATKTFSMNVYDSLYINTNTIPNGRVTKAYTTTIGAKLGTPPYAWTVDSGTLPAGLTLQSSPTVATITGTPISAGTSSFTIAVTDSSNPMQKATKHYDVTTYTVVSINTTSLKTAVRGVPYTDTILASGGASPYVYSIIAGSLPSGISLNASTGQISGTPAQVYAQGTQFTVRVTDSGNPSDYIDQILALFVLDPQNIATTTTINAPSVVYGANGIVTVLVSSASNTPTGNVLLSVDGGSATTQALSAVNGSNPPAASAVFTITQPNIGSHILTATYSGLFAMSGANDSLTVAGKMLNVTVSAANKTYDGTAAATVTFGDDRMAGDDITVSGIAAFADKSVGTGKTVTVTGISISGPDAAKYALVSNTAIASANITKKSLTVTATGVNKVYNGTAAASVTYSDDRVAGDTLTISGIAVFANENVGVSKTVSVSGIMASGADAANYTLAATTASATANITAKTLTITATGVNKVYDGTVTSTATLSDDRIAGDIVTSAYIGAVFATKTVGTDKTVSVTGISISGTDAGNYALAATAVNTTANITAKILTVTATSVNKVYDGTSTATVIYGDNRVAGDALTITGTGVFASKIVGTGKTVNVTGIAISGTDAGNYTLASTTASTTASITAKTLTVTATAVTKVYDGTSTATVTYGDNRVAGDSLTITGTAVFTNKNVGTGKTVSVTGIAISGTDAINYTLAANMASTIADITVHSLTVNASAANKVYDGTTTATVTLSDDRVSGDNLTITRTSATFADKNIGTGKTVSVSGISVSGSDAGNYALAATTVNATANITAKNLTVTGMSAGNKAYDGNTTATLTNGALLGVVSGDIVSFSGQSGTFGDKSIGTSKTVTVTGVTLSGSDAGNYTVTNPIGLTANIIPKAITVTGMTASNKIYDGTTAASLVGGALSGVVGGDSVRFTGQTGSFNNKNVGTAKAVTVTGVVLSGTDAGNYTVTDPAGLTADITPKNLTINGMTASNKVYDGNTNAALTGGSLAAVSGVDVVTFSGQTGTFDNKNVGTAKPVMVTGIALSGVDAGNYTITNPIGLTANITSKGITVTGMTANNKTYDGNTTATLTGGALSGVVSGDIVSFSGQSGVFSDKNVGTGKAVSVTGVTLSGTEAGNYTVTNPIGITANITARSLTVTATGLNKVYNGTTVAAVTYGDDRLVGDVLTVSGTAVFADKTMGTGKAVYITGITISGGGAGNYSLTSTTASSTANITALTLTFSGNSKVYDGTTSATFNINVIPGDAVTIAGTAAFANKSVGVGKTVSVIGIAISGVDAGNYILSSTTANLTASITARSLTVSAIGSNKVYDGTTAATVTLEDNRISGDVLNISFTTDVFANKNVGTGKPVSISGIAISGADVGNYTLAAASASASANITPIQLTITATAADKMYDSTAAAQVTFTDNRIAGDVLTVSGSAAFNDKSVGQNKPVAVSGITLSGTDAPNYSLAAMTASMTASIIPPDGDLDGGGVAVTDALRALRITAGLITATATDMSHSDVAPLVSDVPQPDDVIDVGDVVVILRKSVGLVSF